MKKSHTTIPRWSVQCWLDWCRYTSESISPKRFSFEHIWLDKKTCIFGQHLGSLPARPKGQLGCVWANHGDTNIRWQRQVLLENKNWQRHDNHKLSTSNFSCAYPVVFRLCNGDSVQVIESCRLAQLLVKLQIQPHTKLNQVSSW